MTFHTIAIAATFDHFHKGHEKFLTEAFNSGTRVVIGLTSDAFASEKGKAKRVKFQFKIQNFQTRKKNLEKYLKENNLINRAEIIKIQDIYGPAIYPESDIEALVVTRDTLNGARLVNRKRKELHLPFLKIITVPFELAQDRRRISSSRIRNGELNREGKIYKKLLTLNRAGGLIPEKLRQKLKEPQGELIRGDSNDLIIAGRLLTARAQSLGVLPQISFSVGARLRLSTAPQRELFHLHQPSDTYPLIISIGDEVTKLANELNLPISISIVDFKVNRKVKYARIEEHGFAPDFARKGKILIVRNPPGYIRKSLVNAIYTSIKMFLEKEEKSIIRVHGEEDLAGLPAMILGPIGSIVLYGQPARIAPQRHAGGPQEGIVVTVVTEDLKKKLEKLIQENI